MIDLSRTRDLLAEVGPLLRDLDGTPARDRDPSTRKTQIANITRDLLWIADQLQLAAALVRQEYWQVKGFEDVTTDRRTA